MINNPSDEQSQYYDEFDDIIVDEPEKPTDNQKYRTHYYRDDYYGTSDQELQ